MVDINYDELWNEIQEAVEEGEIFAKKQPHEKTMREISDEWGISLTDAKKAVQKLLVEGKLTSRTAKCRNGKSATVYSPTT